MGAIILVYNRVFVLTSSDEVSREEHHHRRRRHGGQSAELRNTDVYRLRSKHRNKRAKWIGGECALKERQKDGNTTEYRVPSRDDFLYAYTSTRTTKIDARGSDDRSETLATCTHLRQDFVLASRYKLDMLWSKLKDSNLF